MNVFDAFNLMGYDEEPQTMDQACGYSDPQRIVEDSEFVKSEPTFYAHSDALFTPYTNCNWYSSSGVINVLGDECRLPALVNKLDPNKIFTSDIAALKSIAADQIKINKVFERKLMESLTDKSKFGLSEEDIEAMQALTAGRSAVTNIQKEQVAIKKNIADIRLKQEQQRNNASAQQSNDMGSTGSSTMDVGRSILDSIFDVSLPQTNTTITTDQYQSVDIASASNIIDTLIQDAVDPRIAYESQGPKTYVVVGDTDADTEFVTFGNDGSIIADYPNPTSTITKIDRDSMTATDDLLVTYPVKYKN